MKKIINTITCVLCLCIISICCGGMQNINKNEQVSAKNSELAETAKSALAMDYNSETVIYAKNPTARLPIASMVKMMTILITYEELEKGTFNLETKITTTENASGMGGSQVFIDPYVEYKAGDLLKSVVLASANDASVALAEYISGSEEEFVSRMNNKAKELGMDNTLYANCTGLPAPEQYSCAKDCAIILKNVLKHEHYKTLSTIWMDELEHPSGRKTELVNTNKLTKYYKGCDGGKTGSTSEAGFCLTATAEKGDLRLITVVIGAKSGQERFKEASNMFNFGFANYENSTIVNSETILSNVEIFKSTVNNANVYAKESFYGLTKKGDKAEYEISKEIEGKICAPLKSGQTVGKLIVSKEGKVLKEIDIVIKQDIEKMSYFDGLKQIASNW